MKKLALTLALCLMAALARAQIFDPPGPTRLLFQDAGNCATTFACALLQTVGTVPTVAITVSGSWTGTLTFQATSDYNNWTTVQVKNLASGSSVTTTTSNGLFAVDNVGFLAFRVQATTLSVGTPVVSFTRGWASQ